MYVLEDKYAGMYENLLPSMPPGFRCREYIRSVDIWQTLTVAGRMDVRVETMDGKTITIHTTGSMTIGEIVNQICNQIP